MRKSYTAQFQAREITSQAFCAQNFRNIFRVRIRDGTHDSHVFLAPRVAPACSRAILSDSKKGLFSRLFLHFIFGWHGGASAGWRFADERTG